MNEMNAIELIDKALRQLEFLKDLPNQKGVVNKIAKTLENTFEVHIYAVPYFTQVTIKDKRYYSSVIKESLHYAENNLKNHRTVALKNALLKAKEPYESQTIPRTDSGVYTT